MTRHELMPWHPIASLPVVGRHRLDPTPGSIVRLSPVFVESGWTVERAERPADPAPPRPAPEPEPEPDAGAAAGPPAPDPVAPSVVTTTRDAIVADTAAGSPTTSPRRVKIVRPVEFDDARTIGDHLLGDETVLVDLRDLTPRLACRLTDFASGLTYGADGTMESAGDHRFLLAPGRAAVPGTDTGDSDAPEPDRP